MKIRQVLGALDDDHVVRRPLRPGVCPAELFVQHPARGWLALAVSSVPFEALDPAQLFAAEQREPFERRLAQLRRLAARRTRNRRAATAASRCCS